MQWQLTIDANDPVRLATFWAPVLGYVPQPPHGGFATWADWYRSVGVPESELEALGDGTDRIMDPAGAGPRIWFQAVPEAKGGKNRLHLDVYPSGRDRSVPVAIRRERVESYVAELVAAGATRVRTYPSDFDLADVDPDGYFVVMNDPEGNEFCVG